jgi:hypothetical protein
MEAYQEFLVQVSEPKAQACIRVLPHGAQPAIACGGWWLSPMALASAMPGWSQS